MGSAEAGKMALSQTKSAVPLAPKQTRVIVQKPPSPAANKKMKLSTSSSAATSASTNLPKVVTITAEQFMALATRLQQEKTGATGKPLIISLPKNLNISTAPAASRAVPNGRSQPVGVQRPTCPTKTDPGNPLDKRLDQSCGSNEEESSSSSTASPAKMEILPSDPLIMNPDAVPAPVLHEITIEPISVTESIPMEEDNNDCERRNHFLKSGLLKGSARTTPMPLLCLEKKERTRQNSCGMNDDAEDDLRTEVSCQPTLNNAALPLDADDEMFVNEDSESQPPVWLSIMQDEENGQFSSAAGAGADDNDDDLLLDPSKLAAQLASIHRQAASQYSFSS